MRILLLSAYDAGSHARWHRGLVGHLDGHDWTVLTLPPRHFHWRSRGNALTWAFAERAQLEAGYDVLVAASTVDLSTLRGLVPALTAIPTLVYFHENQFAYPSRDPRNDVHQQVLNLYTALSADRVAFNSPYNRDSFLAGVAGFLRRMPDHVPPGVVDHLMERARIVPVPLEDRCFDRSDERRSHRGPLQIVWNHRWEHDKAPERFFSAMAEAAGRGADFRLHVVGQRFRKAPAVFDEARARLSARIDTWGFVADRAAYESLLRRGDVVISTALHEFQGLSVLEACAAGCAPLVPDRLAYRDFIPDSGRYPSFPDDPDAERAALVERVVALSGREIEAVAREAGEAVEALRWSRAAPIYRDALEETIEAARGRRAG